MKIADVVGRGTIRRLPQAAEIKGEFKGHLSYGAKKGTQDDAARFFRSV